MINKIFYLPRPDPRMKITKNKFTIDEKKINIKLLNKKYMSKKQYLNIIKKCNIFIAPRKKEGIGLTIVEAISRGMFIVGYNDSTMNEYISNKKVGFIFDEKTKKQINIKNIIKNYQYRKNYAETNYKKWIQEEKKIIPFLKKESKIIQRKHFLPLFFIRLYKIFYKKNF